ncbi:MAG: PIN domain-containing protein [Candidatus Nanopelagicales bacterium]
MTSLYLDTSVALLAVLERPDAAIRTWLDEQREAGILVASSKLLQLELARVLRREGLDPARARFVLQRCELLGISDSVLQLAAAIETHVKSLDAIHLATAAMLPAPVTIVTRDRRMRDAARTLNLACSDAL